MKTMKLFSILILVAFMASCSKEDPPAPGTKTDFPTNNPPIQDGFGELLIDRVDSCTGYVNVYIDNVFTLQTSGYHFWDQTCQTWANDFNSGTKQMLTKGLHTIYAEEVGGDATTWFGDVFVAESTCSKIELRCDGMITGDAFENANQVGTWTFTVDQNTCGNATFVIVVSNGIKSYKTYVNSGDVNDAICNVHSSVGAKFTLFPGNYNIEVTEFGAFDPLYWNFDFVVNSGDCTVQPLGC